MTADTDPLARRLRELLSSMLADVERVDAYEALSGGITNRSYRVSAGGRDYVVRFPGPERGEVLDPLSEYRAMQSVAAMGHAPAPIGVERHSGVIVTEFRAQAPHWRPAEARREVNIVRAAAMLRDLHQVPAGDLPLFEPERAAAAYIRTMTDAGALDGRDRELADELRREARVFQDRFSGAVFCHNDLVAANILDDGKLMLVDFEYAVRAAPVLDLASLAAMNDYDAGQRRVLLDAYFAEGPAPVGEGEFDAAVRMLRLLAYFWALAMGRRTGDAAAYAEFTDRSALTST